MDNGMLQESIDEMTETVSSSVVKVATAFHIECLEFIKEEIEKGKDPVLYLETYIETVKKRMEKMDE